MQCSPSNNAINDRMLSFLGVDKMSVPPCFQNLEPFSCNLKWVLKMLNHFGGDRHIASFGSLKALLFQCKQRLHEASFKLCASVY
jgi:hypothetical protein